MTYLLHRIERLTTTEEYGGGKAGIVAPTDRLTVKCFRPHYLHMASGENPPHVPLYHCS